MKVYEKDIAIVCGYNYTTTHNRSRHGQSLPWTTTKAYMKHN